MKQLTCEMCGSPNIIKQDGLFVCQNCGTKYSVEEAKNIMTDGSVIVSGKTVVVNNNGKLNNLYQVARRFRYSDNAENAEKYYAMILVDDPNSWEANFYVVYFKAEQCTIAEINSAANSVVQSLKGVMNLIKTYVSPKDQASALNQVASSCASLAYRLAKAAKNSFEDVDNSIKYKFAEEYISRLDSSKNMAYYCGDILETTFINQNQDLIKIANIAWNAGINLHKKTIDERKKLYKMTEKEEKYYFNIIDQYVKKTRKYDAELDIKYEIETLEKEINNIQDEISKTSDSYAQSQRKDSKELILIGCICIVISFFCNGFFKFLLISLGILLIFSGIYTIYDTKDKNERQQNRQQLESQLKEKEAILNELKNKQRKNPENKQQEQQKTTEKNRIFEDNKQKEHIENQNSAIQQNQVSDFSLDKQIQSDVSALMNTIGNFNSAKEIYDYLLQ